MDKPMQFLMDVAKKETVDIPSARMPGYVLDLLEVRDRQWESDIERLLAERDELRALAQEIAAFGDPEGQHGRALAMVRRWGNMAKAAISRTEEGGGEEP